MNNMRNIKRFIIVSVMVVSMVSILVQGAFAASLTASTSLTIVNVTQLMPYSVDITKWEGAWPSNPDATLDPRQMKANFEVYLNNVYLTSNTISWQTTPKYTPYIPFANGINAITAVVWSEDRGKTFKLASWDYLNPDTTFKVADDGFRDCWTGTMVHTICDRAPNPAACNDRKRSNLNFTEYPTGAHGCWGTIH